MLCKNPYMKQGSGITRTETRIDSKKRLAATPFGCGQCLPCRINKKREWTTRLILENTTHGSSCFVTLTYDDNVLPDPPFVNPDTLQKYLKRLRKKIHPRRIRFFGVGEYGDQTWRPHYHLAIYGIDTTFRIQIEEAWQERGFVYITDMNEMTARYITGYVMKKLTNDHNKLLEGRAKEFMRSSKQDGGMGYDAIVKIAKHLRRSKHYQGNIIREIHLGRKKHPLGRYLTYKLAFLLGIPEWQFKREFYAYQEKIFDEHMKPNEIFYYTMQDTDKVRAEQLIAKSKIYKSRKVI